ncbi:hypothetical protein ICHIJ1_07590 [Fluviibacter phosphoraccumulans]|uniref:Uncharacterized protein n=1 Tax=Fluviibacter phosphoraccumulans TaxID=1751046 RepID=A0A679HW68_9RHOO|nr:hypothetical protein ICHIAU1_22510 [Fluviibacter phosphoraccumulans]BBU70840.1 hypothetical protein ICHIJ1_07590 [Fluviibacter phosphoraccumulans]BCA65781.1 hypothetical protein SHINM1_013830 [Fluviibacter phosphoraccumulans]
MTWVFLKARRSVLKQIETKEGRFDKLMKRFQRKMTTFLLNDLRIRVCVGGNLMVDLGCVIENSNDRLKNGGSVKNKTHSFLNNDWVRRVGHRLWKNQK